MSMEDFLEIDLPRWLSSREAAYRNQHKQMYFC